MADKKAREAQTVTKEQTGRLEDVIPDLATGTTAMATTGTTAVSTERRSFISEDDMTGTEDIGLNDVRLPRLAIAQGLSTQLIPDDSSYIDGLKLFDMFNDLTKEIYGRGPLKFIAVTREVHLIEFDPENRGVPLDLDVPPNDPRTLWTKDPETGKGIPPRATRYVDFVVILVHANREPEPVVLSIKCTNKFQTRAAERLSTFIKLQKGPIYSGYRTVASKSEKNDEGTFGVFVIDNAGRLDAPNQTDAEWETSMALFKQAEALHHSLKGKRVVVNRETGAEDTDFNPADLEAQADSAAPRM